jgi:hypothetical protein
MSRAIRADFRQPIETSLSLQSWISCAVSSESKSTVWRTNCEAIMMPYVRE